MSGHTIPASRVVPERHPWVVPTGTLSPEPFPEPHERQPPRRPRETQSALRQKTATFLSPQSRFTFLVNTYAPSPGLSLIVEANVPILAERPMYWLSGGTDVIGYRP